MCGLAGFWQRGGFHADTARPIAEQMALALRPRGPDDAGVWLDEDCGVALAHRRLAVLDLSAAGAQPMRSASGRYVLVFNGEIYNHLALRGVLRTQGCEPAWRGHSDTETLLACVESWGLETTLKRSVGMFALALWDREARVLCLARDRLGEKPLYYGLASGVLLFGSELKALRRHPAFRGDLNRDALTLLLRHGYIPSPYSIYAGISKLAPASILRIGERELSAGTDGIAGPSPYWSLQEASRRGLEEPFRGSDADATAALESSLTEAVQLQMIADVPLGAFLSGGVDSSAIVALMQTQSRRPIKTFTIGFNEAEYNEAQHAKRVAAHLGTEHTELYVTPGQALDVIPSLPEIYNEPFADPSQIPTFLVSRLAREHVTVSLSGDAGDELFGGYNRYYYARQLWRPFARLPRSARAALARLLLTVPPRSWNRIFRLLPTRRRFSNPGEKLHKLARTLETISAEQIYLRLVSHWDDPAAMVIGGAESVTPFTDRRNWTIRPDFESRMMYMDTLCYLPDDILVKVDRAAMAVSLETRVPMLDHRVVELAWRLPLSMKIRGGVSKWILREVLYRHIPRQLIERPKMGFGVPIDIWLRGPLREWAEELLNESRLKREGYFHPEAVRQKWLEHLSGSGNWQYHLWNILMFQAWRAALK